MQKTISRFWQWVSDNADSKGRTLYIDGAIAGGDTWWGDEITPKAFKSELMSGSGDVTVWINSPGGDVFAAAQIYNMLMEYSGHVTVKIDGIAASAASIIAMAGGEVFMSPVSCLMLHNPATIAIGDSDEMLRAKALLDEVKESIINAYELKTGLSRAKISHMMDVESWMNAHKAVELGFADGILYTKDDASSADIVPELAWNKARQGEHMNSAGLLFSRQSVTNSILRKLPKPSGRDADETDNQSRNEPPDISDKPAGEPPTGTPIESLDKRLLLLAH